MSFRRSYERYSIALQQKMVAVVAAGALETAYYLPTSWLEPQMNIGEYRVIIIRRIELKIEFLWV